MAERGAKSFLPRVAICNVSGFVPLALLINSVDLGDTNLSG